MAEEYKRRSSRNRGPGAISEEEAGSFRNKLSQVQTVSKKRKIEADLTSKAGMHTVAIANEIGGKGAITGSYMNSRHLLSPKGRNIPHLARNAVNGIYGVANVATAEDTVRRHIPKYNVGPGFAVGTNASKKPFNNKQNAALGLASAMRGNLNPDRAQRLADQGVIMIEMATAELHQQHLQDWHAQMTATAAAAGGGLAGQNAAALIPEPAIPTKDEVLASIQLALLFGWDNRNAPHGERRAVTKNADVVGL